MCTQQTNACLTAATPSTVARAGLGLQGTTTTATIWSRTGLTPSTPKNADSIASRMPACARALRASICVRISCAVSRWSSTAGCAECALLSGSLGGAFAQPPLRRSLLVRFTGGGGCGYFTFKHDGTMLRCYLKPLFNLDGGYSEIGRCAPDQIGRYGRCVQPRVHPRDRAFGAHVGRHPQFPESVPQVVLAQASR